MDVNSVLANISDSLEFVAVLTKTAAGRKCQVGVLAQSQQVKNFGGSLIENFYKTYGAPGAIWKTNIDPSL